MAIVKTRPVYTTDTNEKRKMTNLLSIEGYFLDINICGPRGGKYSNIKFANYIKFIANFYMELLGMDTYSGNVQIRICKNILPSNTYGDCDYDKESNIMTIRLVYLESAPDGKELLIETLAHELIHGNQFYLGRFTITDDNEMYWSYLQDTEAEVRLYNINKHAETDSHEDFYRAEHYQSPWEVEAYSGAIILYNIWLIYGRKLYDI